MIVDLPDTTVSRIGRALVDVREEGGAIALGRVLTLIIVAPEGHVDERAVEAANAASREHPMRVIVLETHPDDRRTEADVLDAEIRVGGDAGASEVIILRAYNAVASNPESLVTGLLLPDAPVVAWWPTNPPAVPAEDPIGRMAQRRITDASTEPFRPDRLSTLGEGYSPGDTDLAWTRLTYWREKLASALDTPPYEPVRSVEVSGSGSSPSTGLLAAWLRLALGVPVTWRYESTEDWSSGIKRVALKRDSGEIVLERHNEREATLRQPGQPSHELVLVRRTLRGCLAEELRRLDPDLLYGQVVREGWSMLDLPLRSTNAEEVSHAGPVDAE